MRVCQLLSCQQPEQKPGDTVSDPAPERNIPVKGPYTHDQVLRVLLESANNLQDIPEQVLAVRVNRDDPQVIAIMAVSMIEPRLQGAALAQVDRMPEKGHLFNSFNGLEQRIAIAVTAVVYDNDALEA